MVAPGLEHLPSYAAALRRGWFPDRHRGAISAEEQLRRIADDPAGFIASRTDRDATLGPITLPDGSIVPRLSSFFQWLWDGEFCGTISLRWQPGTESLPPTTLGHIGYNVVPWKQRQGYATRALALFLPEARRLGLRFVEITTDIDNLPSQRVIEKNGGILVERFAKPPAFGGGESLRYRMNC